MTLRCLAALALVPILGIPLVAQRGPNQQQPSFKNELLDNLQGLWSFVAAPGAPPIRGGADANWELGHQFLRLHQKEVDGPESVTYIGYDTYDRRLVATRLDSISGARGAETNGYGLQDGNKITFTFDYATVQIRQTWTWDPQAKSWQFLVESRPRRATTWSSLPPVTLQRVPGRGGPPGPRPELRRPPQAPPPPQ
jgi:hypothetical protein